MESYLQVVPTGILIKTSISLQDPTITLIEYKFTDPTIPCSWCF